MTRDYRRLLGMGAARQVAGPGRVAPAPPGRTPQATAELITARQLWSDWLGSGRVHKFAMVAKKQ